MSNKKTRLVTSVFQPQRKMVALYQADLILDTQGATHG